MFDSVATVLAVILYVVLSVAMAGGFLYALYLDAQAHQFLRFAIDFAIPPVGVIHGLWAYFA